MTVVVTRDVAPRVRGFLASSMLELGPGVYTAPRLTPAVRDRIWAVLEEWVAETRTGSVIMTWHDARLPGGQDIRVIGLPALELVEVDGVFVTRRRGLPGSTA